MKLARLFTVLSFLISVVHAADHADMLIFSFDRPLQLYAFLESIDTYVHGVDSIAVLYRVSEQQYQAAYDECFRKFAHLNLRQYKQGADPRADFKNLVLEWLSSVRNEYVLFGVDDIIVKDYVDIADCITHMKANDAHGFYLRLGANITQCYTEGIATPVPAHREVAPGVYAFTFADGKGDWGYPSSVDMTIYATAEVRSIVPDLYFDNPNRFEGAWAIRSLGMLGWSPRDLYKTGLFYHQSKMVNIPFNLVQTDYLSSRNMGYPKELFLEKFYAGYKLDIGICHCIDNKAPHMEMEPTFIER